jgi:hypothetical protein
MENGPCSPTPHPTAAYSRGVRSSPTGWKVTMKSLSMCCVSVPAALPCEYPPTIGPDTGRLTTSCAAAPSPAVTAVPDAAEVYSNKFLLSANSAGAGLDARCTKLPFHTWRCVAASTYSTPAQNEACGGTGGGMARECAPRPESGTGRGPGAVRAASTVFAESSPRSILAAACVVPCALGYRPGRTGACRLLKSPAPGKCGYVIHSGNATGPRGAAKTGTAPADEGYICAYCR